MAPKGLYDVVGGAKQNFIGAIGGGGDIGTVVDTVSDVMVRALGGTHAVGHELLSLGAATVTGVVQGAAEVGTAAGDAARPIMLGALRGTAKVGQATVETVSAQAAALVRATDELGGNVAGAARGAVDGAIAAARDLGLTTEAAAGAAAAGALKAAGAIGFAATVQVRKVLSDVLEEPFRSQA